MPDDKIAKKNGGKSPRVLVKRVEEENGTEIPA